MIKDLICTSISVQFEEGKTIKDKNFHIVLRKDSNKFSVQIEFLDSVGDTTQQEVMDKIREIFWKDENNNETNG